MEQKVQVTGWFTVWHHDGAKLVTSSGTLQVGASTSVLSRRKAGSRATLYGYSWIAR